MAYNGSDLSVEKSKFSGSDNTQAINYYNGLGTNTAVISDSEFSNFSANLNQGAVVFGDNAGEASIINSKFTNNAGNQGGAIWHYKNAGKLTITDSTFTGNKSATVGGAIYNQSALDIISTAGKGTQFSGNTATNGGNDIYNALDTAVLTFLGDGETKITGGIGGTGQIIKNESGTLSLKGSNSDFTGTTAINAGTIVFDKTAATDSYLGGVTTINNGGTLEYKLSVADTLSAGAVAGSGDFLKTGAADLNMSGDYSAFTGHTTISDGKIVFTQTNTTDKFFGGITTIISGKELTYKTDTAGILTTVLDGTGIFRKTGSETLTVAGDNTVFEGSVLIDEGKIFFNNANADDKYFTAKTTIGANGELEFNITADTAQTVNLDGTGTFTKSGAAVFELLGQNQVFTGTVNVEDGTLKFSDDAGKTFFGSTEINVSNADSAKTSMLDYTINADAAFDKTVNLNGNAVFALNSANGAQITVNNSINTTNSNNTVSFNNGTFLFANGFSGFGGTGNKAEFNNTTIKMSESLASVGSSSLAAEITDSVIDLRNSNTDASNGFIGEFEAGQLTLTGDNKLHIELDLKNNQNQAHPTTADPESDKLVVGAGSSGVIDLSNAAVVVDGLWTDKHIDIITGAGAGNGGITIKEFGSYLSATSSNYIYELTLDSAKTGVNISTVDYNNPESLKFLHNHTADNRVFTMNTDDYVILSNLNNMGKGNFVVNGSSTAQTITGNGLWSMFLVDSADGEARNFELNNVNIANTTYNSKDPDRNGSALHTTGENTTAAVNNAAFTSNISYNGGAVYNDSGKKDLEDGTYTAGSEKIKITGTLFDSNTANQSGGAISNAGTMAVSSSVFKGNSSAQTAGSGGGAIDNTGYLVLSGSIFGANNSANTAYDGGAIRNSGTLAVLESTKDTFTGNYAAHDGGAIHNSAQITLTDSNFTSNTAGNLGGALYNSSTAVIDAKSQNIYFSGNTDSTGANDIYNTGSLTFKGDYDTTITGGIAGTGTITKTGTGNLVLQGNNASNSGTTTIEDGKIIFKKTSDADSYFSGQTVLSKTGSTSGTLEFDLAAAMRAENGLNLAGNGDFVKKGAADLTLKGENASFTGAVSIEEGKIVFEQDSVADSYFGGVTTIGENGEFEVNGLVDGVLDGTFAGNGKFTKTGTSTTSLSGNTSAFAGLATISAGKLFFEKDEDSDNFFSGRTVINQGANLEFGIADGLNETINGIIEGTAGAELIKSGAGTLTLTGNNSKFAGTAQINDGKVLYTKNDVNADKYFGGITSVNAGGTLEFNIANTFIETVNGNITGTGDFVKTGAGMVRLEGNNENFTGNTTIETGTLVWKKSAESDKYFAGNTEIKSGAVLEFSNTIANTYTGANKITGDGTFKKSGSAVLTLNGVNNGFTGLTEIENGILSYVQSDGGSYFGGITQIDENGTLNFENTAEETMNGVKGTGDFNKNGTGTLILAGDNQGYTGTLNLNQGEISYVKTDSAQSFVKGAVNLAENTELTFNLTEDETISGNIISTQDGFGTVNKTGTGTLVLNGDNSAFSGETIIDAGKIKYEKKDVNNGVYFSGNTTINENGTLEYNLTANETLAGTISGTGTFQKTGNGTLNLSGANKGFAGETQLQSGVINYVQSNGGSYFGGNTVIAADAVLNFENTQIDNIKELSGSGTLNKTGEAKLNLNGDNSAFDGDLNINEGILSFNKNTADDKFVSGETTIADGAELVFNLAGASETLSDANFGGTGTFTKTGSQKLTLTGDNSGFKGEFNIAQGAVDYNQSAGGAYFGGSTNIGSTGILNFNNTANETIKNLSGSGSLNKEGSGSLALAGDNKDFTGALGINGGSVTFNDNDGTFVSSVINIQGSAGDISSLEYTSNNDNSFTNTVNLNGNANVTLNGNSTNTITITNPANTSGDNNSASYNNATFVFDNSFENFGTTGTGNKISLEDSTFQLGDNTQNFGHAGLDASFENTVIDLHQNTGASGDAVLNELTFNDLQVGPNTSLNIDLDLKGNNDQHNPTTDNPEADKITYNSGSGTINIGTINIATNGEWKDAEITVIDKQGSGSGSVTIGNMPDITVATSSEYEYEIKKSQNEGNIVVSTTDYNADPTGQDFSLKKMHNAGGTVSENRQFIVDTDTPVYKVLSDLGNMGKGDFTVAGQGKDQSTITGNHLWSLFEIDSTDGEDRNFKLENVAIKDAVSTSDGAAINLKGENSTATVTNVAFESNSSANGGAVSNNAGTANITGSDFKSNTATVNGGAINNVNGAQTTVATSTFEGNESGANGGAIYNEAADIVIKDSSFTGNSAQNGGAIYNKDGNVTLSANTSDINFSQNTSASGANDIYMEGSSVLTVNGIKNTNITGGIAGEGSIVKEETGTLNLSGNNSGFNGSMTINGGTVSFNKGSANDSYISGNTAINADGKLSYNLAVDETLTGGTISGTGTFEKTGNANLTINGDNSGFTGTTNIEDGKIIFDKQTANDIYLGGTTNIKKDGALDFVLGVDETINGNITGEGTFTKYGTDTTLTLNGDNSGFSGNMVVEEGTLQYEKNSDSDKYFSGSTTIKDGAALDYTLNVDDTLAGGISGGSGAVFNKNGDATLTLSGNNSSFAGTANLNAGTTIFDKNTESDIYFGGTTMLNKGAELVFDLDLSEKINGALTGDGSFTKKGEGTLVMTGDNSLFTGETTVENGGILFKKESENDKFFAGTVNLVKDETNNQNGMLEFNLAANETISGQITGNGTFIKSGEADLTLTGDNSAFSGTTSINEGKLVYINAADTDSYFSGNTIIGKDASMEYRADADGAVSGISGTGTFEKTGNAELALSGSNSGFTGSANISSGTLSYTQTDDSSYFGGSTAIAKDAVLNFENSVKTETVKGLTGEGTINKSGTETLKLDGSSSEFKGTLNINEGTLSFEKLFNTDKFIQGTTNIASDGTLELNLGRDMTLSSKIEGTGTIKKSGNADLLVAGDYSTFKGDLNLFAGSITLQKDAKFFDVQNSTLGANTFIDLRNTSMDSISLGNVNLTGKMNVGLDVDLAAQKGDFIGADSVSGSGSIVIKYINLLSDLNKANISINIFDTDSGLSEKVSLDEALKQIEGPIYTYTIGYNPQTGALVLGSSGAGSFNPAILAAPVAAQTGGYLTQLNSYVDAFANMDMMMLMTSAQRRAIHLQNRYAAADSNMVFTPTMFPEQNSGAWFRPSTSFERVPLKNGPSVNNVMYSSLFGVDSELKQLKHGFDAVFTGYAGYTGSHQTYDGVSIYQNGGLIGGTAVFYKNNFFGGITANVGAMQGEASTMFGRDEINLLTAGAAIKTGYNWELFNGKFIVQPNVLAAYTFVNTFDYTTKAGVRIKSDPLNAITAAPGVKFIGNLKNGWQPYLSVSVVMNFLDETEFSANEVTLPEMSIKPYVLYGVGVQKRWGERFTGFIQTMFRSGGRNGVGFNLGLRWSF